MISALSIITDDEHSLISSIRSCERFLRLQATYTQCQLMQSAITDDRLLVRFLRASDHDIAKTLLMFEDMMKWRQDFQVERALQWEFPFFDTLKDVYPHGFHKIAKTGLPVYILRLGELSVSKLSKLTHIDNLVRLHVQRMEYARTILFRSASKQAGSKVDQQITILDMKAMATLQLFRPTTLKFVIDTATIDQNNYPEILNRLYILNAPRVFGTVFNMIKPFLYKRTLDKIFISSGGCRDELLTILDEADLPDFLGGKDHTFPRSAQEEDFRRYALGLGKSGDDDKQ